MKFVDESYDILDNLELIIQPCIKALFGNSNRSTNTNYVEQILLYQIISRCSANSQNILNLIYAVSSLFKCFSFNSHSLFILLIQSCDFFFKHYVVLLIP